MNPSDPLPVASVTDDLPPCPRCRERGHECPIEFRLTHDDGSQLWVRQDRSGRVLVDHRPHVHATWLPSLVWTGIVAP